MVRALDQVDKPYALANLVAAAVQTGMHPREWEAASRPTERGLENVADFIAHRAAAQAGPAQAAPGLSEEVGMDITYRRPHPTSRPGRLLAWLLRRSPTMPPVGARIDFARAEPLEVTQT